jgi:hypothetical protein
MTDPGVQMVREWLQRQPFSLRILALILFMEEVVEDVRQRDYEEF